MSNTLNEALEQAGDLLKLVNKMIPQSEALVNKAIAESTKNLKGADLKAAQSKLIQIQQLTKAAKSGKDIDSKLKELIKQTKEDYKL